MSTSTAQDYVELLTDEPQARLALLACSAALRLDDKTAHFAIELVARSNGSSESLMRRVKNLGCIWKDWDGSWYVTEDVRPHLLDRLEEEISEATLIELRERLASGADLRAHRLPADRQVTNYDKLLASFEAAYQRLLIPKQSDQGAAEFVELWQHSSPAAATATARSVDYLADELNQRLHRLPDEVLFLRGMAARSRGDRQTEERYFRKVWERGRRGYIYAVAAHLFGLLIKSRDRTIAERAMRDSIQWNESSYDRAVVYNSLGNLLAGDRRRWTEAEDAYRESLALRSDAQHQRQVYHTFGNLLAKDRHRWLEAEQAYRKSLELDKAYRQSIGHDKDDRSLPETQHQLETLHSLGNLLARNRKRWADAEKAYRKSADLAQDDYSRAQIMHSIGKLLVQAPDRWEEAESALRESLKLHDTSEHQVQVLGTWAVALSELNDDESDSRAEEYALQGIKLAPRNMQTRGILYRVLARIYERRKDYAKAIEACRSWKDANLELGNRKFANDAQAKIDELSQKIKQ